MVSKKKITDVLRTIPDPELNISVWDLGLIYGVETDVKSGKVTVRMTLTTIGCPLFSLIAEPIKEALSALPGVRDVEVDLTFEPPWTMDRMSQTAKAQLGMV